MFSEASAKAGITYPKGFLAAGVKAGLKKSGNPDVALIYTEKEAAVAGTFTKNAVAAAPVGVSKKVVATHTAHAIIANSGCANACTGAQGEADAAAMQQITADALGCKVQDVIVASTGIIGKLLPMDKVEQGIHAAAHALSPTGSPDAGNAILTTDTYSKAGTASVTIGGTEVRLGIIAKGSGMIRPDMATVLCFITTDAAIAPLLLQEALSEVMEHSLNMISIDGDMSTNDMAIILANGAAGNPKIVEKNADYEAFKGSLLALCQGRKIVCRCEDGRHERCEQPAGQDGVLRRGSELGARHLRCRLCGRGDGSGAHDGEVRRHSRLCGRRRRAV